MHNYLTFSAATSGLPLDGRAATSLLASHWFPEARQGLIFKTSPGSGNSVFTARKATVRTNKLSTNTAPVQMHDHSPQYYSAPTTGYSTDVSTTCYDPFYEASTTPFDPALLATAFSSSPTPNPYPPYEPWQQQLSVPSVSYAASNASGFHSETSSNYTPAPSASPPPLMEAIIDQTTTFPMDPAFFPYTTTSTTQIPVPGFSVSVSVQNTFQMPTVMPSAPYDYALQDPYLQQQPEFPPYIPYETLPSNSTLAERPPPYSHHSDARVRKKRKVFNKVERTKVNQIRSMRACLRCRVNKRSCSADTSCSECLSFIKRANLPLSALATICFRLRLIDLRFPSRPTPPSDIDTYLTLHSHVTAQYLSLEPSILDVHEALITLFEAGRLTVAEIGKHCALRTTPGRMSRSKLPTAGTKRVDRITFTPKKVLDFYTALAPKKRGQPLHKLPKKPLVNHPRQLIPALLSLITLLFTLPLTPSRARKAGPSPTQTVLDTLETLLLQETDRLLNSLVLAPSEVKREWLEILCAALEVWEVRFEIGRAVRRGKKTARHPDT
ncbi:hypothetical protein BJ508DRAFT_381234 [Ascobolus immersus RN42]|uniref:Uncharacterized protein n=1 Tax=Ascobolus immersus RN42 TaxID=1160509 RepID=A0A3N4HGA1_ASCIM|nr:hypothetical protein BJ508DRAFT_381234 [Ascobolus immersus RN42]